MASQAINLHLIPYLEDLGYSPALAAVLITARSLIQLGFSPFWGLVVERFEPRYLASGKFLLYAVGIFVLMQATSLWVIVAAVLLYGVAQAGTNVITEVMWANYYGRDSLGAIRGLGMPFTVGFSAIGPLVAGVIYDVTKSYAGAFILIIAGALASAVLVLLCTRPRREPAQVHRVL
jgi:MFS family permease